MITIGVDAHKTIHVALAVDEAGKEVGDWQGPNSEAGWRSLATSGVTELMLSNSSGVLLRFFTAAKTCSDLVTRNSAVASI